MSNEAYHRPVMLHVAIDGLEIDPNGVYVDATFGGGGHSAEILKKLEKGRLIAFDQDPEAAENRFDDERFLFIPQNFRNLKNFIKLYKVGPVNGILADLGVSSHQFDKAERGFSIRLEAPLDMRMNPDAGISAEELLNSYSEDEIIRVFREYGEIRPAAALARKIVQSRTMGSLKTTKNLIEVAKTVAPRKKENQFLAQVFQAIRIEVNDELGALKDFLKQCIEVLAPEGRLVVISYHSLEDRLVKNFMRSGKFAGEIEKDFYGNVIRPLRPLSNKAIIPNDEEIASNPRSRSAKLRIAVLSDEQ